MDMKEIVDTCIGLIDNNYYFRKGEEKKWECLKKKLLSEIKSYDNNEFVLEVLQNCIMKIGDPHTKVLIKNTFNKVLPYDFIFEHGELYILQEDNIEKVVELNGIKISDIINKYRKFYKEYPLALIEEIVLYRIQFLQEEKIKHSNKILYTNSLEEIKVVIPIPFEDWLAAVHIRRGEIQWKPVYIKRIDESCVSIQILSFRDKNIIKYVMEDLKKLAGDYSSIVFDVRNNCGGYVDVAMQLLSMVIRETIQLDYDICTNNIYETSISRNSIEPKYCELFYDKKIFVFVNYRTMSAAEFIFVLGLQIEGRIIIGEQTAGFKNQAKEFTLSEGVGIQITTRRYIRNGLELTEGIQPNIFLENTDFIDVYKQKKDIYISWYHEHKDELFI